MAREAMHFPSEDDGSSPGVASWLHAGFWDDVDREIASPDPSELALFVAAGRMASSARPGYRDSLWEHLSSRLLD